MTIPASPQKQGVDASAVPATPTRRVLTVAGSDSGGGAGIQADLKTLTTLCVYGTSVITALTAQNTLGVQGVYPVPAVFVSQQMASVLDDIGCDAAKTGMMHNAEIIECVSVQFRAFRVKRIVVDPVMISTSGSVLLAADAVSALRRFLIPLAEVLTPNVPEAEALTGMSIRTPADVRLAARELHSLGCANVLIKGGHMPLDKAGVPIEDLANCPPDAHVVDVLFDGKEFREYTSTYVDTTSTHGTGCTLSSAIAAGLANGLDVPCAVDLAIRFVANGLRTRFPIGKGRGPLNHLPAAQLHPVAPISPLPASTPKPFRFVDALLASCPKEWMAYVDHEFVRQVGNGTLPKPSFQHFIKQDYIFLRHYARANALASYRESDMESIVRAANVVAYIGVECQMHVKLAEEWGISLPELESTVEATANLAYTRYVLEKGMSGDRLDLRVALAPCLLGYGAIAQRLAADPATKREGNPYWPWIENYAKPEFQQAVIDGRALLETLFQEMVPVTNVKRIAQLCDTFRQGSILEANFWQMGLAVLP
ncbi:hypothetical protein HKX48_007862 [Thoreauomyces humboldtii]|nr:hypothetical protein HKX48_007862 [Thoreauomyces humboldtii]